MGTYLGFDPRGSGAFGWAVLSGETFPLHLRGRGAGTTINAVGIDAPLFWNPAADRHADKIVRKAITQLGSLGGTVNSVNALRAACLIRGILVAIICQQKTGNIHLAEFI
jgi:hypothetical protein